MGHLMILLLSMFAQKSKAEKEIKELLSLYEDLFKTELPGVTQLKNTRSVIPLVPGASIPN
jgi:hypothetical protein